jgi:uncharacterized protein
MKKLQLVYIPLSVTLAILGLRFVMEAAVLDGRSYLNIGYLIPVFAVYISRICLRNGLGYGSFLGTFMLYTVAVRLAVILLSLLGEASGLGGSYFASRNVFFLIASQLVIWPLVSLIAGALAWPIVAGIAHRSYRRVAVSGSIIVAVIFLGIPYGISWLYTSGLGRRSFENTPESFGIAYEDITFTPDDGLALKGWYIPNGESIGTVVFCHGLFNQRSEMLEQAAFMHGKGYNALLFDFRHHGESEGAYTTFGYFERNDVKAAISYARGIRAETGPVVLWGISMGAANALQTSSELDDVTAVIAESSFYTVKETLRQDLSRMFRLPILPFAWLVETITDYRLGIRLSDLDVGAAAAKIVDCPVLLVGATGDVRMPIENNRRLFEAIPGDAKDSWVVEGSGHADIWEDVTDEYKSRVSAFLDTYLVLPVRPTTDASLVD